MPQTQSKHAARQWPVSFLFIAVCLACLLLAFVAASLSYREILHEWRVESAKEASGVTTGAGASGQAQVSAESLKNLFDNLRDRTDNLQKLITTLIALSSLYAIVLAVTGYLNVQKVLLDAQSSLQDVLATKEALGKEYGSLTHISENLERVTRDLRDRLPDVRELSASFDELTLEDHEKLYFQEKAISFAQLVVPDGDADIAERLSGAFVTLARFYRGLYLSKLRSLERKRAEEDNSDGVPHLSEEDAKAAIRPLRERALFYAKQAALQCAGSFMAHNELGNCLLEYGRPMEDEALKQFRESLKCNRDQQKARFALSSILHRRGEYKKAEDLLSEALGLELWETTRESARRSDLYYNRACAYCKMAEEPNRDARVIDSLLKRSMGDLRRANVTRSEVSQLTFREDMRPGGDLSLLAANPRYAEALQRLV